MKPKQIKGKPPKITNQKPRSTTSTSSSNTGRGISSSSSTPESFVSEFSRLSTTKSQFGWVDNIDTPSLLPPITKECKSVAYPVSRSWSVNRLARVSSAQIQDSDSDSENGCIFIDSTFPHNSQSIDVPFDFEIKWLRPIAISVPEKDESLTWTVYNRPTFSDVCQGQLGNCWFLSALTVVAEIPDLLKHIFITKEISLLGKYELQLFIDGSWKSIIVDDHFPCNTHNSMLFSKAKRKQLWVPLIEKAYAKVMKSYNGLISGDCNEAFLVLTGAPCYTISFNSDADVEWKELKSAKDAGYLMGASCGSDNKESYENVNIFQSHAYSLLNVENMKGRRLIKLRNPWGNSSGIWNYTATKQLDTNTLELLRILELEEDKSNGIFWIPFENFTKYFHHVYVCKIKWGFKYLRKIFNCMSAFYVTLAKTSHIEFTFYQNRFRKRQVPQEELMDLCIFIFETDFSRKVGKLASRSEHNMKDYVTVDVHLEPGIYICLCLSLRQCISTYQNDLPKIDLPKIDLPKIDLPKIDLPKIDLPKIDLPKIDLPKIDLPKIDLPKIDLPKIDLSMHIDVTKTTGFAFGMNSTHKLEVERIIEPNSPVIIDCLIRFILDYGKKYQYPERNVRNYFHKENGMIGRWLLVENMENETVVINAYGSKSENVASTRGRLQTIDAVKPKHRLLLNLFHPMAPFKTYNVQPKTKIETSYTVPIDSQVKFSHRNPVPINTVAQWIHQCRPIA